MQMLANAANTAFRSKLVEKDLSYKLTGILFRVHNKLGRFCNEKQYCDSLEEELNKDGLVFEREKVLDKLFPGERVGRNRIDFFIAERILLEVKAKDFYSKEDYFQVRRYLTALNKKLGIIVNFRQKVLHPKRILNSSVEETE